MYLRKYFNRQICTYIQPLLYLVLRPFIIGLIYNFYIKAYLIHPLAPPQVPLTMEL